MSYNPAATNYNSIPPISFEQERINDYLESKKNIKMIIMKENIKLNVFHCFKKKNSRKILNK